VVVVFWVIVKGMSAKRLPSVETLRELFEYHEDGYLLRKQATRHGRGGRRQAGCRAGFFGPGYYQVGIGQSRHMLHRVIYALHYGSFDETKMIDHVDGDRTNNRIGNLRLVDMTQNLHNSKVWSTNTSGYTGVSWSTRESKWRAAIRVAGRSISLGQFNKKEDAIAARKAFETQYGLYPRNNVQ